MSTKIHFNCQNCALPYMATQETLSQQYSGTVECVDCKKVAHEWTGFYNILEWRPVRMRAPGPMGHPPIMTPKRPRDSNQLAK
jgi:hypothetical protein